MPIGFGGLMELIRTLKLPLVKDYQVYGSISLVRDKFAACANHLAGPKFAGPPVMPDGPVVAKHGRGHWGAAFILLASPRPDPARIFKPCRNGQLSHFPVPKIRLNE